MNFSNRLTQLFNIQYPLIQAGMVWSSGWRLASAVSNAGGLGLIGCGSMNPQLLQEHIRKCREATDQPFGINIPLMKDNVGELIEVIAKEKIKIVFTSAGNPATWTNVLKQQGMVVVHVVSSTSFAIKAEKAGCDAVVAEGFEAGGHNGREETTTLVLTPAVCNSVKIPVISAGGIVTGRQMFAVMTLGAEGVQLGSRFVASYEASAHPEFKQAVTKAKEGDTLLTLKQLIPVRLLRNQFLARVQEAEHYGATREELGQLLGRGRAKKGMFEGDLNEGELEIGQSSILINDILPAGRIVEQIWTEFTNTLHEPLTKL